MSRNREPKPKRYGPAAAVAVALALWAAPATASGCRPPEALLSDFRLAEAGRIAADRARAEQLVHRALGTGVSLAFGRVRERVPIYGDWAYGWVESYVTSYELLIRGLLAGAQAGAAPWQPEVRAAVVSEMQRFVFDRFDTIVVRPAELPQRLQGEWETAAALAASEWQVARARTRAAVARFLAEHCPAAAAATADDGPIEELRTAGGLPLEGAGPIQAIYRLEGIGKAETIFLRSTRPFGARLAILLARVSEAGSALAVSSFFGIGGLTGPVTGFVGALATVWTLDWAINRGDELLHRTTMEADLRTLIAEIEREMLAGMLDTLTEALGAAADDEMNRLATIGR